MLDFIKASILTGSDKGDVVFFLFREFPLTLSEYCDTMKGVRQADDLFALPRNQAKAWARDLDATGSGQGNAGQGGIGSRNPEKAVGKGWRRRVVDNGQQKEAVREGQSGWVGIPSSFVEILLEIHACVSLQMYGKCSVTELPFLHFELT